MADPRSVLIVDDEPLARDRLRDLLGQRHDVTVVGASGSGDAAVRDVARLRPEILLLDVQMPGMNGFDVVEALAGTLDDSRMPFIIFVTAYEEYAVRAFEVSAVDYLRKPVSRDRLEQALGRAIDRLALRSATETPEPYASRFVVRRGEELRFVKPDEIDWIDAAENYVRLHVRGAAYLLRSPIGSFQDRLDPSRFVRIHRSAIVNLDRVQRIEPFSHGEFVVVTADGVRLRSSRAHSARLRALVRTGIG